MTDQGGRISLAQRRIDHWDQVSRERALTNLESVELERAVKQVKHDARRATIRAQAEPPQRRRGKK